MQVSVVQAAPIWAKSKRGQMHCALAHSLDTAAVFLALCERDPKIAERIGHAFDLPAAVAVRWGALVAGSHDMGKITPAFQSKDQNLARALREAGFSFPNAASRLAFPHGTATAICLASLLIRCDWPKQLSQQVADAVGGHHGIVPTAHDRQTLPKRLLGTGKWDAARKKDFNALLDALELQNASIPAVESIAPADIVLLAGLVTVADWIASNEAWFPFTSHVNNTNTHFGLAIRRAEKALNSIGWFCWRSVERQGFVHAFGREPNSLQQEVEGVADELNEPTLAVVEAPPGHGKTEAGLYLAMKLVERCGHRGVIVALPTQATANQMLGRIKEFLKNNSRIPNPVLQLLHSSALLNESFIELLERGRELLPSDSEDLDNETTVVAGEWFTGAKRGLLASFGVGTIDQVLLAALRTKHVFVRQMALANKVVIVDEVHAYDPYMLGLLERAVEWLAAHGSSVLLMSATLPTERRARLIDAYNRGRKVEAPAPRGEALGAVVTWATRSGAESRTFIPAPRKAIGIRWIDGRLKDENGGCPLANALERKLIDGGCAVIVCNNVGRAQAVYRTLRNRWSAGRYANTDLILFHARFPQEDRARIEDEILRKFGKNGNRPFRAVVVATQVIEQSLDLDFDLVVSDMAPIDLLIQRAGRGHRHERNHRPIETAELWIIAPEFDANGVPKFNDEDAAIYHAHTLLRTWYVLQDPSVQLANAEQAAQLVDAVYRSDQQPPEGLPALATAWRDSAKEMSHEINEFEARARERRISGPVGSEFRLADLTRAALGEGDMDTQASLCAETRLGAVRVSVVLAYESGRGPALDLSGIELVPTDRHPTIEEARRLLERSVPISHRRIARELLELDPPQGWKGHSLLRHCRLIVLKRTPEGKLVHRLESGMLAYVADEGVIIR